MEDDLLDRTVAILRVNLMVDDSELAVLLGLRRPASARFWRLKALDLLGLLDIPPEQLSLFQDTQDAQGAIVKGQYRYTLWRQWDESLPRVLWVMLNPSVADASIDDPTLRRVRSFSRLFGCGSLEVVNLFAFRSSDPKQLALVVDPVGPENDHYIRAAVSRAAKIVAAWGTMGKLSHRDVLVLPLLGSPVYCLGVTRDGSPCHPLYLRRDVQVCRFV